MMSTNNLLYPANGTPIIVPTQDVVLGIYYLTQTLKGAMGQGHSYGSVEEVLLALDAGRVDLHAKIKLRFTGEVIDLEAMLDDQDIRHATVVPMKRQLLTTTVGRVLFNAAMPPGMPFINGLIKKKGLKDLFIYVFQRYGKEALAKVADTVKNLGFLYATRAGISIGIDDMVVPEDKLKRVSDAEGEVDVVETQYLDGAITNGERYNKVVDIWTKATDDVANAMFNQMKEASSRGFNPIFMMADSGARGSNSRSASWRACAASWPSPRARSSSRPSPPTSARA